MPEPGDYQYDYKLEKIEKEEENEEKSKKLFIDFSDLPISNSTLLGL